MVDTSAGPVLSVSGVHKSYHRTAGPVEALRGVDLLVGAGSVCVIQGRSGSGKTTLLNILGSLDEPSDGTVTIKGNPLGSMNQVARSALRRTTVGFIFQSFGLLPMLSAQENVEVPLRLVRSGVAERQDRAAELLGLVGLGNRLSHRPSELSGGEQQRVAIARALANRPDLLLADEPTGQLDSKTGQEVVDLLSSLVRADGIAAVIATHDRAVLSVADQALWLEDGQLTDRPPT